MSGTPSRPGSRRPARSGRGGRAPSCRGWAEFPRWPAPGWGPEATRPRLWGTQHPRPVRPCPGKCQRETGAIAAPPRDGPASATWKRMGPSGCRKTSSGLPLILHYGKEVLPPRSCRGHYLFPASQMPY
ncbi:PREDICTED: uncharacterized protein LOC105576608 [Cercocebus atys]|uniref:uncharacterized protein LOC105576608 n=1 Tax=Cercocebus atys TaxID=9531 RepID=UPI0005F53D2F|nr:PREDICTED: uncharacterized protein LOC105576608 [Cercocebus atys]